MQVALTLAQWLVRIAGVLLLILGLLIWTENMSSRSRSTCYLGCCCSWVRCWRRVSTRAGVPVGLAAGVAVGAIVMLAFGHDPGQPAAGRPHWIIQILHLPIGMAAVGMGEAIGGRMRERAWHARRRSLAFPLTNSFVTCVKRCNGGGRPTHSGPEGWVQPPSWSRPPVPR